MFPRRARLTRDGDFARVYKTCKRIRIKGGVVCLAKNNTYTRVAVVASRKVSTRATKRNLYKRRTWAALQKIRPDLPKVGFDIVVVLYNTIADIPAKEILTELYRAFGLPNKK